MYIKPTKEAKGSIFEVHADAADILIYPAQSDNACPWDADIFVERDRVILIGSIVGGSANTIDAAGYCRCEVSIENFSQFYKLEVPEDNEELISALAEAGWVKA